MGLTIHTFFRYYAIHPDSTILLKEDRLKAKIATVFYNVFTLGFGSLISYLLSRNFKIESPTNYAKIQNVVAQTSIKIDTRPPRPIISQYFEYTIKNFREIPMDLLVKIARFVPTSEIAIFACMTKSAAFLVNRDPELHLRWMQRYSDDKINNKCKHAKHQTLNYQEQVKKEEVFRNKFRNIILSSQFPYTLRTLPAFVQKIFFDLCTSEKYFFFLLKILSKGDLSKLYQLMSDLLLNKDMMNGIFYLSSEEQHRLLAATFFNIDWKFFLINRLCKVPDAKNLIDLKQLAQYPYLDFFIDETDEQIDRVIVAFDQLIHIDPELLNIKFQEIPTNFGLRHFHVFAELRKIFLESQNTDHLMHTIKNFDFSFTENCFLPRLFYSYLTHHLVQGHETKFLEAIISNPNIDQQLWHIGDMRLNLREICSYTFIKEAIQSQSQGEKIQTILHAYVRKYGDLSHIEPLIGMIMRYYQGIFSIHN